MSGPPETKRVPRIVCVGGGWVAARLVRAMRCRLYRGEAELTVISRDNFLTVHGLIAEMLTGKIQPQQIISPARRVFRGARFYNAEVEAIDPAARTVTATRELDGRSQVLEYDHLVLGLGAVDDLSRYPGIREHTMKLKSFWDCFQARSHLLGMLEMAEIETDPEERKRLLTFVVAGGNYAGIEIACELVDWLRLMARTDYPRLPLSEARVVVVHSGERILPELGTRFPSLVRFAERRMKQLNVELRLGTRVSAATPEEVVLNNGERIATRTIFSCTGVAASPLLDALPFPRDERGRVKTDACLRVEGTENVWAAGDCAAMPHPSGGTCPQLALYAATGGLAIGRNLVRLLDGKPLRPYRFGGLGEACSLGHRSAIAQMRGIATTGLPAWIGWRIIVLYMFVPSWGRRVRLLFDWLATPLLGREVVNPKLHEQLGIEQALFEPGQVIVQRGDQGRRLYLVRSGEVERLHEENGETRVEVLGAGARFGVEAALQGEPHPGTVRAKTRVRLLAVDRDAARAMHEGGVRWCDSA